MSVAPLPPPRPRGAAALARLQEGLDMLAEVEDWEWGDAELVAAVEATHRHVSAAHAAALRLVAEVDQRGLAADAGSPTTAALLTARVQLPVGQARAEVRLAHTLRGRPAIAQALASGSVNVEHARVITAALDTLPAAVDETTRSEAEQRLLQHAERFTPRTVGRIAKHLVAVLDPDGPPPEDRPPAEPEYFLHLRTCADGAAEGEFRVDPVTAVALTALVDAWSAPRPSTVEGPDARPAGRRRADALAQLVRLAAASEQPVPGHGRPTIAVTTSLAELRDGLPVLGADDETLTAAVVRRMACDAGVIPVVLGSRGEVLDVGRRQRTVPVGMRRALIVRDRGCAFPQCDRPPGWTDAHHVIPWSQGGATSLANLVLLCGHHHDTVHHRGWSVHMGDDCRPAFTPPAWLRRAAA
jgi:hypothetical protein